MILEGLNMTAVALSPLLLRSRSAKLQAVVEEVHDLPGVIISAGAQTLLFFWLAPVPLEIRIV